MIWLSSRRSGPIGEAGSRPGGTQGDVGLEAFDFQSPGTLGHGWCGSTRGKIRSDQINNSNTGRNGFHHRSRRRGSGYCAKMIVSNIQCDETERLTTPPGAIYLLRYSSVTLVDTGMAELEKGSKKGKSKGPPRVWTWLLSACSGSAIKLSA